jgi:hypothetical protein
MSDLTVASPIDAEKIAKNLIWIRQGRAIIGGGARLSRQK